MFCQKCGNEIPNDSQFCPVCGANSNGNSPVAPIQSNAPKKSNKGLIGVIVAIAVVAVIAIVAIVLILGGKSKNNNNIDTPSNNAPVTQTAEGNNNTDNSVTEIPSNEAPATQNITSANWYDFVFVEGNQSIDLPCTLREFIDTMVTSGKSDIEAELNDMDSSDLRDFYAFDMSSDNYKDIDLSYTVKVYKNGATNIWDYTVCTITVKGNQTSTYPDVNLQPGIYIGMDAKDMLKLAGEPDNKNETSGGKIAYLFENGNYELEVDCDENGKVYWFSCEFNNW